MHTSGLEHQFFAPEKRKKETSLVFASAPEDHCQFHINRHFPNIHHIPLGKWALHVDERGRRQVCVCEVATWRTARANRGGSLVTATKLTDCHVKFMVVAVTHEIITSSFGSVHRSAIALRHKFILSSRIHNRNIFCCAMEVLLGTQFFALPIGDTMFRPTRSHALSSLPPSVLQWRSNVRRPLSALT